MLFNEIGQSNSDSKNPILVIPQLFEKRTLFYNNNSWQRLLQNKGQNYEGNLKTADMETEELCNIVSSPTMEEEINHEPNGYAEEYDQEIVQDEEEGDGIPDAQNEKTPEKNQKPKKKRTKKVTKRKKVEESSDEEDGEDKKEKKKRKKKPAKKHFERRNIKDVMTTDRLEASTLNAMVKLHMIIFILKI